MQEKNSTSLPDPSVPQWEGIHFYRHSTRQFDPELAALIRLSEAIILNQIHYWLERSKHVYYGFRWIYNTYEEWEAQFPYWSAEAIRKVIRNLEVEYKITDEVDLPTIDAAKPPRRSKFIHRVKRGPLLISNGTFNKAKSDRTKWYRIDYPEVEKVLKACLPDR